MKKTLILCTMLTALLCMMFVGAQAMDSGKVSKAGSTNTPSMAGLAIPQDKGLDIKAEIDALEAEALMRIENGMDATAIKDRLVELRAQLHPVKSAGHLDEGGETCATAVAIGALPYCDTGNTSDNLADYGASCVGALSPDVVYTLTGAHGPVTASLCGSGYDTGLHVWSGGCPDHGGVEVACNDDACGLSSCVTWTATATVLYYIIVDGYGGLSGAYRLNVTAGTTCVSTPCETSIPGDNCENALPFPGVPSVVTGNTCGFNDDLNAVCWYTPLGAPDVVYEYTPTQTERVDLDLCGGNTNYDTKLYVFDGDCAGNSIRCNDDLCANPPIFPDPYISLLTCVEFLAGHTYYIVVDGYSGVDCGDYTLTSTLSDCPPCDVPPPNDDCASVTPVPLPATFTGTRDCATPDCPTFNYGNGNVWIAFYTTETCDIILDYCDTPVPNNFWLPLTRECPCQTFTVDAFWESLSCPNGNGTLHWNNMPAGTYYYPVLRDDFYGAIGPYTINVRCEPITGVGRCCYGPEPQLCVDALAADCQALGGTWAPGLLCELNPCGVPFECLCAEPMDGRHCNLEGGPIPDYPASYTPFPINVPVQYHITDLNVCLDIGHTYDWDLYIALESPTGTIAFLSIGRGGDGDDFLCTTLDDEAAAPISAGFAPFRGSFRPDMPLSAFDGENAAGVWTLWILDRGAGDVGTLKWVCLTFDYDEILAVELSSFDAIARDGEVELRWTTASETNNDHFEIVRDGSRMAQIATQGNGASGHDYAWVDRTVENGTVYSYTLVSVDVNGNREELATESAAPSAGLAVITEYALHQNYPNPFNPETQITFDLVEAGSVNLTVYNVIGQKVAVLLNRMQESGRHVVTFDAAGLPSGLYLYRIEVNGFVTEKKMLLMK